MIQMNLEGIPCPLITFCCSHNCVAFKIIWCKGKNFYDKGKGINAEPLTMGINGLYQIVRTEMELPPLGGAVFIFFSKNRQQVKLLKWDGEGFLLYQKRLERRTFELPFFDPKNKQCKMPYRTLSAIMSGICLKSMKYRKMLNL